jgi:hypothetical protein
MPQDAGMPKERFTKHRLVDRIDSSAGYSVRLRRDAIEYADEAGTVSIDAEWAPGPGTWVLVFADSIPGSAERPPEAVIDNLERAFTAAGWGLSIR